MTSTGNRTRVARMVAQLFTHYASRLISSFVVVVVFFLMSYVVCLHRDARMLTNYFQGFRINYRELFERARNLHLM